MFGGRQVRDLVVRAAGHPQELHGAGDQEKVPAAGPQVPPGQEPGQPRGRGDVQENQPGKNTASSLWYLNMRTFFRLLFTGALSSPFTMI